MATPWYRDPLGQGYDPNGHTGVDVQTPIGTPLTALLPGTITDASHQPWGWQVVERINLPGVGWVSEVLAHLDSVAVKVGQTVMPGTVLGTSGGENLPAQYSDGPHTHIGLYTGPVWENSNPTTHAIETVNPMKLLDLALGTTSAASGTTLAQTSGGSPAPWDVLGSEIQKVNSGIVDWLTRGGLILGGAMLILLALVAIFLDSDRVRQGIQTGAMLA